MIEQDDYLEGISNRAETNLLRSLFEAGEEVDMDKLAAEAKTVEFGYVEAPMKLSGAMVSVQAKIVVPTDDGEVDLDDLLAESMVQASTAVAAKVARTRLRAEKHKLTPAEVEELELDIERHELVQNWEVVGAAVAFTRTLCKCGKQHTAFEALMERQRHRRETGTLRWHRVREVPQFAPRTVIFHEVEVPLCSECAFDNGWDLRDGEVKAYEKY